MTHATTLSEIDAKGYQFPAIELALILDRALNTLDPKLTPAWALRLSDELRKDDRITLFVQHERRKTPRTT